MAQRLVEEAASPGHHLLITMVLLFPLDEARRRWLRLQGIACKGVATLLSRYRTTRVSKCHEVVGADAAWHREGTSSVSHTVLAMVQRDSTFNDPA